MVNLKNISFSYGDKKIFRDYSLTVNDGEKVMLYGASGCGKSTLLRIISGLERADGTVITDGKISMVFQDDRLLKYKTVLYNASVAGSRQKAEKFLRIFGLGNSLSLKADSLSGGMARRVSLARALTAEYDILLLDEPFSGLDTENKEIAVNLIKEETLDKTVIFVSHEKKDADLFGARLEILHEI